MPDIERNPGHFIAFWGFIGVGIIILLTLIANAIGIANIYWQAEKAKLTAYPRVTQHIYETENIIAKVAFFHDKCNGVKEKIAIFENNYQRYTHDKEIARLETDPLQRQAAVGALENAQQDVTAALNAAQAEAAAYNSASAQYTQNPFKANNLPYRIELPYGEEAASKFQLNCE